MFAFLLLTIAGFVVFVAGLGKLIFGGDDTFQILLGGFVMWVFGFFGPGVIGQFNKSNKK